MRISLSATGDHRELAVYLRTCTTRELECAVANISWLAAFGAADLSEIRLERLRLICAETQHRHLGPDHRPRPRPGASARLRARWERLVPALLMTLLLRSHRASEVHQ